MNTILLFLRFIVCNLLLCIIDTSIKKAESLIINLPLSGFCVRNNLQEILNGSWVCFMSKLKAHKIKFFAFEIHIVWCMRALFSYL